LCKAWILFIPTYWFLRVEGNPISWSPSGKNGIFEGVVTGVAMSGIIFVVWATLGDSIDTESMVEQLQNTGLTSIEVYLAGMFYWIFLNSMLEEYVFRWFITVKGIELTGSELGGIIVSALMFTLHHALALHLFGFEWWQTGIACFGLISAAAIWSWLYIRHRSIWVCWISHAICDVAVFAIGYQLVFN
jgi:membrane protease YdiL (CAAX protease family)